MARMGVSTVVLALALHGCAPLATRTFTANANRTKPEDARGEAIARAQVWTPTRVSTMNVMTGPKVAGAFPFRASILCTYLPEDLSGASPKFACAAGEGDELKVKYGGGNAEVYAEVAATRLLWALGFGADAMYSVRVSCRGCPPSLAGIPRPDGVWLFDPATVERKMRGREFPGPEGWHWRELDTVNPALGGAPLAHRDALKLLAVFLQHTDTKPQQQRLLCLDAAPRDKADTRCARPFMMVNDLGLTFGRANPFNANDMGMNLVEWSATPVWKDEPGCVGNLARSMTGTLEHPVISEPGRRFLADLLVQLTDAQLRQLFEVSRVTLRLRDPRKARSGFATVQEWVDAFKAKRSQVVDRRCA
jgi:hypothetical protein